ncbi:hypothetical protein MXD59_19495 [Frankia sp. Ag45/Mut15]|uniref:Transcriptional regulator, XRE family n=1 Tax=Frankia umida TaxID=573489 RepID=A0ABT0K284_9ACTN|nr:hypothetical protein [Frankia umida]MCK9877934.1 hypothetical protein [Frankia umida]
MSYTGETASEDPDGVASYQDPHEAITRLWGRSNDRSVESRAGLSKTTINDLRNRRRRLTEHSVTRIVEAFDPRRRTAWLAAWHRLQHSAGLGQAPCCSAAPPRPPRRRRARCRPRVPRPVRRDATTCRCE